MDPRWRNDSYRNQSGRCRPHRRLPLRSRSRRPRRHRLRSLPRRPARRPHPQPFLPRKTFSRQTPRRRQNRNPYRREPLHHLNHHRTRNLRNIHPHPRSFPRHLQPPPPFQSHRQSRPLEKFIPRKNLRYPRHPRSRHHRQNQGNRASPRPTLLPRTKRNPYPTHPPHLCPHRGSSPNRTRRLARSRKSVPRPLQHGRSHPLHHPRRHPIFTKSWHRSRTPHWRSTRSRSRRRHPTRHHPRPSKRQTRGQSRPRP